MADVPVSLYQTNVILCPERRVKSQGNFHPPEVPVLARGGRSQLVFPLSQVPTPYPVVIPESEAPSPTGPQSFRVPKWENHVSERL